MGDCAIGSSLNGFRKPKDQIGEFVMELAALKNERLVTKIKILAFWWAFLLGCFVNATHAGINEWTSIGPEGGGVRDIEINPISPRILYAATRGAIYKTTDDGATWQPVLNNIQSVELEIAPSNPDVVYAVGHRVGYDLSLFKTTDGGETWQRISFDFGTSRISALAIDPRDSNIVYAGGDTYSPRYSVLWKTVDGGANWDLVYISDEYGQGIRSLAIDPSNSEIIYAGNDTNGNMVIKTTNGGGIWQTVLSGTGELDVYALAIDPGNSQVVFAGSNRGNLFRTVDGGETWDNVGVGGPASGVISLAIDPNNTGTIYAGIDGPYDSGNIRKSTDGGSTWQAISAGLERRDVSALAISTCT